MVDSTIRRSIAGTIGLAALSLASAAGAIALFADGNWWGIALVLMAGDAGARTHKIRARSALVQDRSPPIVPRLIPRAPRDESLLAVYAIQVFSGRAGHGC